MSRQYFYSRPIGISSFSCAVDSDNLWMQHLMFCAFPLFLILKKIEKPFLLRLFILVTCQPRIRTTKLLPIFKIRLWLKEYAFMTLVCACSPFCTKYYLFHICISISVELHFTKTFLTFLCFIWLFLSWVAITPW